MAFSTVVKVAAGVGAGSVIGALVGEAAAHTIPVCNPPTPQDIANRNRAVLGFTILGALVGVGIALVD